VYDDVSRLGASATTCFQLAWYLSQYSFLLRKVRSFQQLKYACFKAIPKSSTRTAIKKNQIKILEQQRTKNFKISVKPIGSVVTVLILQLQKALDL